MAMLAVQFAVRFCGTEKVLSPLSASYCGEAVGNCGGCCDSGLRSVDAVGTPYQPMKRTLPLALVLMLLVSCATVFTSVVSLTQVVDGAAKTYARLYNDGLVPPDVAAKVSERYLQYRNAARVAKQALEAYKLSGGDPMQYQQALAVARQAAWNFVNLLLPLLSPQDSIAIQTQLGKATTI